MSDPFFSRGAINEMLNQQQMSNKREHTSCVISKTNQEVETFKQTDHTFEEFQHGVDEKNAYAVCQGVATLCIVAVKVHHTSNPNIYVETLALLDNGSQATFVTDDVLSNLDAPSTDTNLEINTVSGTTTERSSIINGLCVCAIDQPIPLSIKLPKVYSRSTLPSDEADIPTPAQLQPWPYLNQIANHLPKIRGKVGLLIGSNCPKALEPMEIVHSRDNGPFAFRSRLGWCITGQVKSNSSSTSCHRIQVQDRTDQYFQVRKSFKDLSLKEMIIKASTLDFHESSQLISLSQDDKRFLEIMKDIKYKDGHYYLPLPLRDPHKIIPNNRSQCLQRAAWLKQRLLKNDRMFNDYKAFMQTNIEKGYVKLASNSPTPNKTWYIPHHGVYHPRKPDKIRVVFDCTAKYQGYCLNQELIQGPDLTNQLIGVLLRFRQYPVAVMADIESMFYQVRVPEEFHDNLRFIWWPDGDLSKEPVDYQMCVHLFGATSSPSCANYALRQTADANKETYGDEASKSLYRNFYVDDLLKSYSNVSTAIQTTSDITKMCHSGGFRLTKFMSNEREFLATIPDQEKAKSLKDLDMSRTQLPSDRALGMKWCPENDIFTYQLSTNEKPLTRRGLLSSISSVYDPLGLASPYLLEGKKLLQLICSERCGWDEPLSSDQSSRWIKWRKELVMLEQLQIDRCFRPKEFKDVVSTSLHHFSDASADAYGQVSYLRFKSSQDEIICKLVISKSRVAPRKRPTIPRLELTAGVISVKVSLSLNNELDLEIDKNHYWTDSQVVLSYLLNEVKRFHLYVTNRVQFIREHTTIDQWKYVPSKENPADDTSRGLNLSTTNKNQRWLKGPVFLYRDESKWPTQPKKLSIGEDDREVKHVKVNTIKVTYDAIAILEIRISSWIKMKRVIARMLQWLVRYRRKLDVLIIQSAETVIFQSIQRRAFANDINNLMTKKPIKRHGSLWRLSPFLDSNSLIRVGGRISHSNVPEELKHPIILPKESNVTKMIVRAAHQQMQHGGRNATLSRLRDQGFWVINGNSLVRHIISKCVSCRRLRGAPSTQKMADLPEDRTTETAPFTYVGTDLFGPFMIKERRSLLKRYGIIFTCMSSRAVHLECVSTMDTDSFIQCLRRFIGRRGNIRLLRCDNGTNFVGARNELAKALQEMDEQAITNFLLSLGADFISWKHNTPTASNHGGVWERMIRTTRAILSSLMMTHGESLNDESFRTLLVEVEATINSRPLTVECINDPTSLTPISPSNILTMKSSVVMPPPGHFVKEDVFCRRRWRRVQHIANEFWSRWRKEYLTNLQARSKWCNARRDLTIGDVVLMKEDTNRNCWKLVLVQKLHKSQDGHVRSVQIKQGSNTYDRPTNKLVLLVENDVKILKSSECTE
ncbi:uncharacterized protein [Clytia hemisphaerica]|uniref:uncharacterized protein n=1 Tax=Clytia hemisphaerica TaxID=252671 RepID=UPI0034D44862